CARWRDYGNYFYAMDYW
nr:immunoglobulin heavy chain junction region [Mus musculus]